LDRQRKIEAAQRFASSISEDHQQIVAIALGGSVARGNDLEISDIDLWCFVREGAAPSIEKPPGVRLDVEQYPASLLTRPDTDDSYFCGFISDARILLDRNCLLASCQESIRGNLADPEVKRARLVPIRESVERNFTEFEAAIHSGDPRVACRASAFAAWSFSDHLLTDRGSAPGGPRGIARLAAIWPDAYEDLVSFEAPSPPGTIDADRLIDICMASVEGKFLAGWIVKARWMFTHGHEADAYHCVWLALALQIKAENDTPEDQTKDPKLTSAAQEWLDVIGWNRQIMMAKQRTLRKIIDRYCGSPGV
jgi:predicted nucleotidyltransferase